jgi:hypothetical protein
MSIAFQDQERFISFPVYYENRSLSRSFYYYSSPLGVLGKSGVRLVWQAFATNCGSRASAYTTFSLLICSFLVYKVSMGFF